MSELAEVAAQGNRLATLKVLRDQLARSFSDVSPGVLPQLTKQFTDLLREIDELEPPAKEASDVDGFRAELSSLLAGSEGVTDPA